MSRTPQGPRGRRICLIRVTFKENPGAKIPIAQKSIETKSMMTCMKNRGIFSDRESLCETAKRTPRKLEDAFFEAAHGKQLVEESKNP